VAVTVVSQLRPQVSKSSTKIVLGLGFALVE